MVDVSLHGSLICVKCHLKNNHNWFRLQSGIELLLCEAVQQGLQIFHHYQRQFPKFLHLSHISHCSLSQVKRENLNIKTVKTQRLSCISGEVERRTENRLK